MVIIEDSRQQAGKHEVKHERFSKLGDILIRSKLPFGDYALPPKCAVDTKETMNEIAQNIGGRHDEHERFKRECVAARDAGCQLVILVENTDGITRLGEVHTWTNPRLKVSPKAINGPQLEKAMRTMTERYGVRFEFCRPSEAADRIREILLEVQHE